MAKLRIKLVQLGEFPFELDYNRIKNFKSSIFKIEEDIDTLLLGDAENPFDYSTYNDEVLEQRIPFPEQNVDFILAITTCNLENNFYIRRFKDRKVIFSFENIRSFFEKHYIPLKKVILKVLYMNCLGFDRNARDFKIIYDLLHDDPRSCLFDMNGKLENVTLFFLKPKICDECKAKLQNYGVPLNVIKSVESEIKKLKRSCFYKILDWIKENPFYSVFISFVITIILDNISSFLYDLIKKVGCE